MKSCKDTKVISLRGARDVWTNSWWSISDCQHISEKNYKCDLSLVNHKNLDTWQSIQYLFQFKPKRRTDRMKSPSLPLSSTRCVFSLSLMVLASVWASLTVAALRFFSITALVIWSLSSRFTRILFLPDDGAQHSNSDRADQAWQEVRHR